MFHKRAWVMNVRCLACSLLRCTDEIKESIAKDMNNAAAKTWLSELSRKRKERMESGVANTMEALEQVRKAEKTEGDAAAREEVHALSLHESTIMSLLPAHSLEALHAFRLLTGSAANDHGVPEAGGATAEGAVQLRLVHAHCLCADVPFGFCIRE